ncbi:MAG: diacylglycerol kinase family protein [Pirellulaceae bacterium]|nr:diacylglycerol kinase family protein [Pirellulaceae bacterium]
MDNFFEPERRSWTRKFRDSFRGCRDGIRGQSSFQIHFMVSALVVASACYLELDSTDWCILLLCIAGVLSTEMLNSALEELSKAVDAEFNSHIEKGLNIASAAVLLSAIGASLVGLIILGTRLGSKFQWW